MDNTNELMRAAESPAIDQVAEPLSKAVRGAYEAAGPAGQGAKNALHGVWLGHPLHRVFTDLPIGAWTTALALDAAANGDPGMRHAATFAMHGPFGVGLLRRVHGDFVQGDVRKLHPWLQPSHDCRVDAIAIVHDHVCHAIAA